MAQRYGGSFAPPLTDDTLKSYERQIGECPDGRLKEALTQLLTCVQVWWALPEPSKDAQGRKHQSGVGTIIDLHDEHKQALDEHIPWSSRSNGHGGPDELEAIQTACEGIDPVGKKELRDTAFHLLWHVHELDLDREPITADKL